MPCDTLSFRLTDQQIEHFKDEGYLIVPDLFTDAEL